MASIKKNFVYTMLYEILVIFMPLLTSPYVSRVLGAERIGIYSYTFSVANYFVMFSMLGLTNYGNRVIAQNRDDKKKLSETFSNLYCLHSLVASVVLIAYVFYYICSQDFEKKYVLCQGLYVLASVFNIDWFFFGLEEFKITVTRNSIIKLGTAGAVFLFVKDKRDLLIYILILAAGNFGGQVAVWSRIKKYIFFCKPSWRGMKQHVLPLLILFIPTISISMYKTMDKIMLGAISNKVQLGFYENSEKIIAIPMTVITAFGNVMNPRMTYLRKKDLGEQVAIYMRNSMEYIQCLAYAFAFGIAVVGPVFAPIFFGTEFQECGVLISLLAICIPFLSFANVIRTQYLLPNNKDWEYNMTLFGGAISNLIVNSMCISRYGARGAVYGTIVAEVIVCVLQIFVVRKYLPIKMYFKIGIPYIFFGSIMYVCVRAIRNMWGISVRALILEILIGMLIYGGFCAIYAFRTNNRLLLDIIGKTKKR